MAALSDVVGVARNLSRDFGSFFDQNFASVDKSNIKLVHPLVQAESVTILDNLTSEAITTGVAINARNGLLRFQDPSPYSGGVTVSGIHYQWFLDEDLAFLAELVVSEHLYSRPGVTLDSITGVEIEVMGIGTLVQGMWALLAEFSTDIDVSSPEGMNIPAHQRYQQLVQLVQYWEARYNQKAAMLNVGLNKIEIFSLRRIARLTNRYPPMYRGREIDNPRPPIRLRPPIPAEVATPYEQEEAFWAAQSDQFSVESWDFGFGGWSSLGTGG